MAGVSVITGIIKNLTFIPIFSAKCLNIKKTSFYEPIVKSLISSGLMTLIFVFISKLFIINSWMSLILVALLCGLIGFILSFVVLFNKKEVKKFIILIKNKIKRSN